MSGAEIDAALGAAQLTRDPSRAEVRRALVHAIAALRYQAPAGTSTNATAGQVFDACQEAETSQLSLRGAVISLAHALEASA